LIRDEFLALLRCPADRQPMVLADDSLVSALNESIAAGRLKNKGGDTLARAIDGAVLRQDRQLAYPIIDGIPVMLIDEAIPLFDQLPAASL